MLPDIPYMYDCYMASQDAPDDLAHYEAFFIQVEKRLKRSLTGQGKPVMIFTTPSFPIPTRSLSATTFHSSFQRSIELLRG